MKTKSLNGEYIWQPGAMGKNYLNLANLTFVATNLKVSNPRAIIMVSMQSIGEVCCAIVRTRLDYLKTDLSCALQILIFQNAHKMEIKFLM